MLAPSLVILILCSFTLPKGGAASICQGSQCPSTCGRTGDVLECSCPEGMLLSSDSKSCSVPVTILLGMNRAISALTEGEGEGEAEVRSLLPVGTTAFDFHYNKKEIIAFADNILMRYAFAGELTRPKPPTAILTPTSKVTSLAVDWLHQDVYWISRQRSAIETSSLAGHGVRDVVVEKGESSPDWKNLVVDPSAGKLFWLGRKGVHSSDLRGENLKNNLTSWPVDAEDIALDTKKQLIYVIGNHGNGVTKVVAASRYDGTRVGELVTLGQSGSKIFGFGVLGNVIYWESNHEGENLYKCELPSSGGKAKVTLVHELNQIVHDMKIYHPDIQKSEK